MNFTYLALLTLASGSFFKSIMPKNKHKKVKKVAAASGGKRSSAKATLEASPKVLQVGNPDKTSQALKILLNEYCFGHHFNKFYNLCLARNGQVPKPLEKFEVYSLLNSLGTLSIKDEQFFSHVHDAIQSFAKTTSYGDESVMQQHPYYLLLGLAYGLGADEKDSLRRAFVLFIFLSLHYPQVAVQNWWDAYYRFVFPDQNIDFSADIKAAQALASGQTVKEHVTFTEFDDAAMKQLITQILDVKLDPAADEEIIKAGHDICRLNWQIALVR